MKKNSLKGATCFGTATIGERGQIVIPAEIRKKLKIKSGGKFVVFLSPSEMIVFIPVDRFGKIIAELNKKLAKLKQLIK